MIHRRSLLAASAMLPAAALAQPRWQPSRPLRMIVPFVAGGSTDVAARVVSDAMGEKLG
ncbi:MAG: transporter substrate-binding protein, partial [Rubritepida sp.]|nr:transporter substrate-binding protein [Rubritepida sp.]